MLEKAIAIAVQAHAGQVDKVGQPYILHPLRVMLACEDELARIVAVLHDVVEDTDVTMDKLRAEGFPERVLSALDCVTKRPNESYDDFIARAAADPIARRVKLADLADNMDLRRLPTIVPGDAERLARYVRAWRTLNTPQA